jgi:hypothetical protein
VLLTQLLLAVAAQVVLLRVRLVEILF